MVLKALMKNIAFSAIILSVLCLFITGCAHGPKTKLYVHDYDRQLFIRDLKNRDVLTYKQADGLICQKPEDVKKYINQKK